MRHSIVRIERNTVTKTTCPELMRVEVEKTRRAFEIARDCRLFRVPEVIEYDEVRGVAVFERLAVQPIARAVPWGPERIKVAECLGTSLAIIHRELTLPDDMRVQLPDKFAWPNGNVFLHGDVSIDNVCVGLSCPPIAIVDWQMTPCHEGRATYGARYFDLFWFISNLINCPYTRFLYSNPVLPVTKAFIESYFREAELPYDAEGMVQYAKRFFSIEMPRIRQEVAQNSKGRARLLLPFCRAILRKFMKSLTKIEPKKELPFVTRDSDNKNAATIDYRYSHRMPGKGRSYHEAFSNHPYRRMVWQFEQEILDRVLAMYDNAARIHYLDFACGTGRILSFLEGRTEHAVGVDLSQSMLEVAHENISRAELLDADLTKNDVLGDRQYNLITAFRFFPNAQQKLRSEAMQVLSRHLQDGGYLVFNNHKNVGCIRNRLARLFGRCGYQGMSAAEVKELLKENRLKIVTVHHLCVFPASERHMLLPAFLLRHVERFLAGISVLREYGENLVYVCRRAG